MDALQGRRGFTLVELAIVMTIIGLLIGGVLKGQEMMQNARLKSTVQQVKSYQAAYQTFMDAYGVKPGDMSNATSRIPACTAANYCADGNGNGFIGTRTTMWTPVAQDRTSENQQFWMHLSLTNMISGVTASPAFGFGESHPAGKIGGGFAVVEGIVGGMSRFNRRESTDGLWFRLSTVAAGAPANAHNADMGNEVISSGDAAKIDRQFDDGEPWSGWIRATSWGVPAIGAANSCEGEYDETGSKQSCILGFTASG